MFSPRLRSRNPRTSRSRCVVSTEPAWADGFSFTTISVAGAASSALTDISSNGLIVGYSCNTSGAYQGLLDTSGTLTSISDPGAFSTFFTGVNASGRISDGELEGRKARVRDAKAKIGKYWEETEEARNATAKDEKVDRLEIFFLTSALFILSIYLMTRSTLPLTRLHAQVS